MDIMPRKVLDIGPVDDNRWIGSQDGIAHPETITLDPDLFPAKYFVNGYIRSGCPLAQHAVTKLYGPYDVTDEQQTITVGGTGLTSFTLTYSGQTTGSLPAAATAEQVRAALVALSNIDEGDVIVSGPNGGPWLVSFVGKLADTNVAQMTTTPTGGSGTVTVATTVGGGTEAANLTVLDGFLYGAAKVRAGIKAPAAQITRGVIRERFLPYGPIDANGKADVGARFRFLAS